MPLDKKFFEQLRKSLIPKFRKHIWKEGKDAYGKDFPDHPAGYQAYKDKNAAAKYKGTQVPGFTGQLHNSFGIFKVKNHEMRFGTTTMSARVEKLAKGIGGRKRIITIVEKPLPDHLHKHVMDSAMEYTNKQFKKVQSKWKGKKVKINL